MQLKMTREHKLMAYLLNKQFNYTMTAISQLMQVSQSTISTSVREVEYWHTIQDLTNELAQVNQLLLAQGAQPQISTDLKW